MADRRNGTFATVVRPSKTADALDAAFEALGRYDWGHDERPLREIDDAVAASYHTPARRSELETRLAMILKTGAPRPAKNFACRKLSRIGTATSVPALADLLTDEDLSHMARYALERIPCGNATNALREALPHAAHRIRLGLIKSLGVRRDLESTSRLVAYLEDPLTEIAAAAAVALGQIATSEAARALLAFQRTVPERLRLAAADACLACAGKLTAEGKRDEAQQLYEVLCAPEVPDPVRFAALRARQTAREVSRLD